MTSWQRHCDVILTPPGPACSGGMQKRSNIAIVAKKAKTGGVIFYLERQGS